MKGNVNMLGTSKLSHLVLADNGRYDVGVSGKDSGEGLNVLGGKYKVAAGGTSDYKTVNVDASGTIESAGTTNYGKLTNAGHVTLATVSNFGADNTYTQTGAGTLGNCVKLVCTV